MGKKVVRASGVASVPSDNFINNWVAKKKRFEVEVREKEKDTPKTVTHQVVNKVVGGNGM